MKLTLKHQFFFGTLFILLVFIFMVPNLLSKGMFVDGEYYATIARNMARGQGNLWAPIVTVSEGPFYDHPPLVFGLESLFFRALGDSFLVELLYSFITFAVTIFLIIRVWKLTVGETEYAWLPLLLWVLTPLVYWGYVNNLLENTMGVFCLASFVFLLNAWRNKRHQFFNYLLAGSALSAALLSKGPVGLFPLVIPLLYWITTRKIVFNDVVVSTGSLIVIPCIVFAVLWLYAPAHYALYTYFNKQIIASLTGTNMVGLNVDKYIMIKELSNQFIPIFVIIGVVISVWWIWFRKHTLENKNGLALFFLLVAISASFPIMISKKQYIHYALCSMPFYTISAAIFILSEVRFWVSKINFNIKPLKVFTWVMFFAMAGILVFSLARTNKNWRNNDVLDDLDRMNNELPKGHYVQCTAETLYDFYLKIYLYRFYDVSFTEDNRLTDYYIARKENLPRVPAGYKLIVNGTTHYFLFKKIGG